MQEIKIEQRTLGAVVQSDGTVELRVWAPLKEKVEVDIEGTIHPLQKETGGYWTWNGTALKAGDRYKLRIDGGDAFPDPVSLAQPEGVHGPSEVVNTAAFRWNDTGWKNHELASYILYELHTGTFSEEGMFAGIEAKLDYLVDLGINAIEVMPVAQFPGNRNWGYDGVFPFAAQNSYGGAEGLHRLVDACHRRGIAVVLDVVYNHMGPEGNYLGVYGPYFTGKYQTPWGGALNFDDAWSDGVRRYFIENALMWLRDFHIDALRLDAVHAIKDFGASHFLRDLRLCVDRLQTKTGRRHYLIAECDLNDPRFIDDIEGNGFGMHSQWIDEFHHALRVTATGEKTGYYSDFSGISHLAKAYRDGYVYDGQWSDHRKKFFGLPARGMPGERFIVFSQNHDQVGNRMLGERSSCLVSFEMQKLMAGAVLLSPFLPMLWMGEEWAEPNPFLYFVSHTDQQLAAAVREGRRSEFAAFHAQGEAPDPVAEETFRRSRLQWELSQKDMHAVLLRFYKALIHLRKSEPVFTDLNREAVSAEASEADKTLILQRQGGGQTALCLMNFSEKPVPFTLPVCSSAWKLRLDSSAPEWGGNGSAAASALSGELVELQPESFILYTHEDV
ncbi:MAG: malto-oligosyltrehalose trehalohydrolase [Sphingobacteriales bacterium]|nr:MAG: malto-oligosyltrehalose trehalohydrolase [Sphingobacteriales bacterium]